MGGAILMIVIIILFFISSFAIAMSVFAAARQRWVQIEVERTQAFYLAEAALALSLHELKYGVDVGQDGLGTVRWQAFGPGRLRAVHDAAETTITAEGVVQDVRRVVQLKYEGI